jgi:hypothetical protein
MGVTVDLSVFWGVCVCTHTPQNTGVLHGNSLRPKKIQYLFSYVSIYNYIMLRNGGITAWEQGYVVYRPF